MILVKVNIIKQGYGSVKISILNEHGRPQIISVSRNALIEKDGEYFVQCSYEPIEGAHEITVDNDDVIFSEE